MKSPFRFRYGIPSYRLPDEVLDAEIQAILDLGVELRLGVQVGRDVAMDDLRRDFQAVYLAIGAQKGVNLGIKGEDAPNCFSGVDFLQRVRVGEISTSATRSSSSAAATPRSTPRAPRAASART